MPNLANKKITIRLDTLVEVGRLSDGPIFNSSETFADGSLVLTDAGRKVQLLMDDDPQREPIPWGHGCAETSRFLTVLHYREAVFQTHGARSLDERLAASSLEVRNA
jgi:hypothetical protein